MYTPLWLSLVYTLRASQDHLNLEKYRFAVGWIYLLEETGVKIVRACESRNTQQRCSSNEQKWAYSLIEESSWFRVEIQG